MTAVVAALLLAVRRRDHRFFAAVLLVLTLADLGRAWLDARFGLVDRPPGSPPFTGSARAAFHVDQGIELLSSAGLAALAIWHFAPRRSLLVLVAIAWTAALAYLVSHYPSVRGEDLRNF